MSTVAAEGAIVRQETILRFYGTTVTDSNLVLMSYKKKTRFELNLAVGGGDSYILLSFLRFVI